MGQGGSKAVVHVQLDGSYYYAGDSVTGAVVLHVEQPIDVKGVFVKVTGVEKTKWIERRHSSTPAQDVTYKGKHVIFKHKLPIKGPGTINPGDYQWPISFQLPPNVPGTFHYDAPDHRAKASLEYKVKAAVDQEGFFKSDFKKTLRFDVLQRTKVQQPSGPVMLNKDMPISSWCCFNKGHMNLSLATDTDSYLPGEAIRVNAQVDNKSSTQVTLVEIKLHQRLHLMGESFLGQINKHIDVVRVASRQQAVNGTEGAAGLVSQYQGVLDLHRAMEATCMGKVIRSTYELEVTAKTGCCLSEATLKQPIFINDPQPHTAPPAVVPPPGWMPQVYPTVAFQVPALDCYTAAHAPAIGSPTQQLQAGPQHYPYQHQQQHPASYPAPSLGPQPAGTGPYQGVNGSPINPQYQTPYEAQPQQQLQLSAPPYQPSYGSAATYPAGAYPPGMVGEYPSGTAAAYPTGTAASGVGQYHTEPLQGVGVQSEAVCYVGAQQYAGQQTDKLSGGYTPAGSAPQAGSQPWGYPQNAAGPVPTAPTWGQGY